VSTAAAALHVLEYNVVNYRRVWRGSVLVSFVSPLLFLTAMGVGLGGLVNQRSGGLMGVSYRDFLAPGLLAATAMQTASSEMTYPVVFKVHWGRIYDAMLATPVGIWGLLFGEIAWIAARLLGVSLIFFAVTVLLGTNHSLLSPLAVLAATLTGLSFATPILAFSATRVNDSGFATLFRFVITPLFLFGGAFFPVTSLPAPVQVVAWLTPLAHGVALTRGLSLGTLTPGTAAADVAILLAYAVAGTIAAGITLRRRLVK
jgi:lipooligosaccharide transport system permease protein